MNISILYNKHKKKIQKINCNYNLNLNFKLDEQDYRRAQVRTIFRILRGIAAATKISIFLSCTRQMSGCNRLASYRQWSSVRTYRVISIIII